MDGQHVCLKNKHGLPRLAACKTLESSHTTQKRQQGGASAAHQILLSLSSVIYHNTMQSSLCFALLATAAALQAPMTRTQQRRVVANRAPMVDVLAPTSTALCAGADDDYTAPKIEFDPDAPTGGRDLYRTTVWNSTTVILSSSAGTFVNLHAIEQNSQGDNT